MLTHMNQALYQPLSIPVSLVTDLVFMHAESENVMTETPHINWHLAVRIVIPVMVSD